MQSSRENCIDTFSNGGDLLQCDFLDESTLSPTLSTQRHVFHYIIDLVVLGHRLRGRQPVVLTLQVVDLRQQRLDLLVSLFDLRHQLRRVVGSGGRLNFPQLDHADSLFLHHQLADDGDDGVDGDGQVQHGAGDVQVALGVELQRQLVVQQRLVGVLGEVRVVSLLEALQLLDTVGDLETHENHEERHERSVVLVLLEEEREVDDLGPDGKGEGGDEQEEERHLREKRGKHNGHLERHLDVSRHWD